MIYIVHMLLSQSGPRGPSWLRGATSCTHTLPPVSLCMMQSGLKALGSDSYQDYVALSIVFALRALTMVLVLARSSRLQHLS